MKYRRLGRTDMTVSAVSFGGWAIGGEWGPLPPLPPETMAAVALIYDDRIRPLVHAGW